MHRILVVEDNKADVVLIQHAFSAAGILCDFVVAQDGQQAMDHLSSALQTGKLPSHVLLDLKLPLRDGLEVLAWIRSTEALSNLSVIVLTSSNLETDRSRAERFGIDAYLIKPDNLSAVQNTAMRIAQIWELPPRARQAS